MRQTIVFIIEKYYPNYSAVGICAGNIVEELANNYNIIVIKKKEFNDDDRIIYNSHYIINYSTKDNNLRNYIDKKLEVVKGNKKYFYLLFRNVIRGLGYLGALFKNENLKNQDVRAIYEKLESIEDEIDVIIPTCLPIETMVASIKYKNNVSTNTKIIPLVFDKFSENSTLHRTKINKCRKFSKHIAIEKNIFKQSDGLIFVESWREHLNKYFVEYKEKFIQIEHPLIKKIDINNTVKYDPEKINIIYTGALYKKIRSPLRMLDVFENVIKKENNIVLHFYITGDCDHIIQDYNKKYPDNIMYYGKVKSDVAKSAIVNADILLSIGNTDSTQLPSKIFEYISTGNPIIHFYSNKDDPAIEILNRYRNSSCIDNNDRVRIIEAKLMKMFNEKHDKVNFDEIENIYKDATPKYTADIIMNLIENR